MHIAICENSGMHGMERMVDSVKEKLGIDWTFKFFSEGMRLLSAVNGNEVAFDGVILDDELADISGLEVGRQIRTSTESVELAFLGVSPENALAAFELNAVHYVKKPVTEKKLEEILKRFSQRIEREKDIIRVSAKRRDYFFPVSDIIRIQSSKKRIDVYTVRSEFPVKVGISFTDAQNQIMAQVGEKQLIKISRGLIVNMDYISGIRKGTCYFEDGTSILISRAAKMHVQESFIEYQAIKLRQKGM